MGIRQNHDWRYDLKIGQEGENFLSKLLRKGQDSYTVEVKLDTQAHRTGNLFFEYRSRDKPSGLVTTQSDYYAVMTAGEDFVIIVRTELLKMALRQWRLDCIQQGKDPAQTWEKRGGDDLTSVGMLVPITQLIYQIRRQIQKR